MTKKNWEQIQNVNLIIPLPRNVFFFWYAITNKKKAAWKRTAKFVIFLEPRNKENTTIILEDDNNQIIWEGEMKVKQCKRHECVQKKEVKKGIKQRLCVEGTSDLKIQQKSFFLCLCHFVAWDFWWLYCWVMDGAAVCLIVLAWCASECDSGREMLDI